jgi:hypothetical protein
VALLIHPTPTPQGLASYVAALGGRLELVANFGDERLVIG